MSNTYIDLIETPDGKKLIKRQFGNDTYLPQNFLVNNFDEIFFYPSDEIFLENVLFATQFLNSLPVETNEELKSKLNDLLDKLANNFLGREGIDETITILNNLLRENDGLERKDIVNDELESNDVDENIFLDYIFPSYEIFISERIDLMNKPNIFFLSNFSKVFFEVNDDIFKKNIKFSIPYFRVLKEFIGGSGFNDNIRQLIDRLEKIKDQQDYIITSIEILKKLLNSKVEKADSDICYFIGDKDTRNSKGIFSNCKCSPSIIESIKKLGVSRKLRFFPDYDQKLLDKLQISEAIKTFVRTHRIVGTSPNDILKFIKRNPNLYIPFMELDMFFNFESERTKERITLNNEKKEIIEYIITYPSDREPYLKFMATKISSILNENKKIENSMIENKKKYDKELTEQQSFSFYKWQKVMIEQITKEKRSIVVSTPTSSGKTVTSMSVFEYLKTEENKKIVYIAPTFDLCLQFYSDLLCQFGGIEANCRLITGVLNTPETKVNTKFYIGTPNDLIAYLAVDKIIFDFLIFDEIHLINTINKEYSLRSDAMLKLFRYSNKQSQFICLSATITLDDIKKINENIKTYTDTEICNIIITDNNLTSLILKNNGFTEVIMNEQILERDRSLPISLKYVDQNIKLSDDIQENTLETSPENTWFLLNTLKNHEHSMFPLLFFDNNEDDCYENFIKYIDYLDAETKLYANSWFNINNMYSSDCDALNLRIYDYNNLYSDNANNKTLPAKFDRLIKDKKDLYTSINKKILDTISKLSDVFPSKYLNLSGTPLICLDFEYQIKINNEKISLEPTSFTTLSFIVCPCDGIPPFLTLLKSNESNAKLINISKELRNAINSIEKENSGQNDNLGKRELKEIKKSENNQNQIYKEIKEFYICEKIDKYGVEKFINYIQKGLLYGVSILTNLMPFTVKYQILKLLKDVRGGLRCIFSSKSMATGINRPIKSVICRTKTNKEKITPSDLKQQIGRAGRLGHEFTDNNFYAILWNIKNTTREPQEEIIFPIDTDTLDYGLLNRYDNTFSKIQKDSSSEDPQNINFFNGNIEKLFTSINSDGTPIFNFNIKMQNYYQILTKLTEENKNKIKDFIKTPIKYNQSQKQLEIKKLFSDFFNPLKDICPFFKLLSSNIIINNIDLILYSIFSKNSITLGNTVMSIDNYPMDKKFKISKTFLLINISIQEFLNVYNYYIYDEMYNKLLFIHEIIGLSIFRNL